MNSMQGSLSQAGPMTLAASSLKKITPIFGHGKVLDAQLVDPKVQIHNYLVHNEGRELGGIKMTSRELPLGFQAHFR